MQEHEPVGFLVDEHPVLRGLGAYLKKEKTPKELTQFICQRVFFAYPRTLWLKVKANTKDEALVRQTFDPRALGGALHRWATEKTDCRRIVFDLREVTILDLDQLVAFFDAVTGGELQGFIVCEAALDWLLTRKGRDQKYITNDATAALQQLRKLPDLRRHTITLPAQLSAETLNQTLLAQASKRALAGCDAVRFDLGQVVRVEFDALALLAPVVHSLALEHGVLSEFVNGRNRKIGQRFEQFNLLGTVGTYLTDPPERSPGPEELPSVFPLHVFTDANMVDVQVGCERKFYEMLETFAKPFAGIVRISKQSSDQAVEQKKQLILDFRKMIHEMADNVAEHSGGVGYLGMEFEPGQGLHLYVGDTGVGLAKGLAKRYRLPTRGDAQALAVAFNLGEQKHLRRKSHRDAGFGGRGLDRIGSILGDLRSELSIRSGEAEAVFEFRRGRKPAVVRQKRYRILGTHMYIFVPVAPAP
ncbi:MAG: hypothetical protein INR62_00660 [Rhodospirillales bacterium]|nr:hypothetical protein [Acetobacter sp.]